MAVELESVLKIPSAWDIPVSELLTPIQKWIRETRPTCLLHPHGFYVLLLKRTASEEWRLHLWPGGERKVIGMPARIHSHDRHVESRILTGHLVNIDYQAQETITGGNPLYLVSYLGDRYERATSNVLQKSPTRLHVQEKARSELHTGEHYRIERHTLHEAVVSSDRTTVTLVCMHSQNTKPVMVVGVDGHADHLAFERIEIDAAIYLDHLGMSQ